jgi:hypothetical protein
MPLPQETIWKQDARKATGSRREFAHKPLSIFYVFLVKTVPDGH